MSEVNTFHRPAELSEQEPRRDEKKKDAEKKEPPRPYAFINPFHNV